MCNKLTFVIDGESFEKLKQWKDKHKEVCTLPKYRGAIGGGTSYVFSTNSLGYSIEVKCDCGAEEDLTDYAKW